MTNIAASDITSILTNPSEWSQDKSTFTMKFNINVLDIDVDFLFERADFSIRVTKHHDVSHIITLGGKINPKKSTFNWDKNDHILTLNIVKDDHHKVIWETPMKGVYTAKGDRWDDVGRTGDELEEAAPTNGIIDWMRREVYKGASEEQMRAIEKSFRESQGTTISTNWDEVSKGPVSVKRREDDEPWQPR